MSLAAERLSLALPVDVIRSFDQTILQSQLEDGQVTDPNDDLDVIASYIEDAEDEFRQRTGFSTRDSRMGVPGDRDTYEVVEFDLSGHRIYRRRFSHATFDYDYSEEARDLMNDQLKPFDPDEDDAFMWRGVAEGWENVSDEYGETWSFRDERTGEVAIHPVELHEALTRSYDGLPGAGGQQTAVRLAVSYRYGASARSRSRIGTASFAGSLGGTESDLGTVAVDDIDKLPRGPASDVAIYKSGGEYFVATPDRDAGELDVKARGVRGTSPEAHADGDRVLYVPPTVRKAVAARACIELLKGSRVQAYLPDNESDISKGDLIGDLKETYQQALDTLGVEGAAD